MSNRTQGITKVYTIGQKEPGLKIERRSDREYVLRETIMVEMPRGFLAFCRRSLTIKDWPKRVHDPGQGNFLEVWFGFTFDGASAPDATKGITGDPHLITEEALRHDIGYRILRAVWAKIKAEGKRLRYFLKVAWQRRRMDWAFLVDIKANHKKAKAAVYYAGVRAGGWWAARRGG